MLSVSDGKLLPTKVKQLTVIEWIFQEMIKIQFHVLMVNWGAGGGGAGDAGGKRPFDSPMVKIPAFQ